MAIKEFKGPAVTYFVTGAVLYGSGLISWEQVGLVSYLFNEGTVSSEQATGIMGEMTGALASVGAVLGISPFAAAIAALVEFVQSVFTFLFWPFTVLMSQNVPFTVSLLLGGTAVMLFFLGIVDALASK